MRTCGRLEFEQCHKDYCQAYIRALKEPNQYMGDYIATHK